MVFDTCFFCEAYVHDGVNLEVCGMDGHDVSFDTPKCAQFSPATTKESKFSKLFRKTEELPELLFSYGTENKD